MELPIAELLVMNLVSEMEEMVNSKEFKRKVIINGVKEHLKIYLETEKITSTEYQSALEVLNRYIEETEKEQ